MCERFRTDPCLLYRYVAKKEVITFSVGRFKCKNQIIIIRMPTAGRNWKHTIPQSLHYNFIPVLSRIRIKITAVIRACGQLVTKSLEEQIVKMLTAIRAYIDPEGVMQERNGPQRTVSVTDIDFRIPVELKGWTDQPILLICCRIVVAHVHPNRSLLARPDGDRIPGHT